MNTPRIFKSLTSTLCAVLATLLSNCTTSQNDGIPLKPEHRAALRTVSVSPEVKEPAPMSYLDLGTRTKVSLAGAPLGLLGALIIAPAVMKSAEKDNPKGREMREVMARNGIRPEQIVRSAFEAELRRASLFQVAGTGGDAVFKLTIGHGLSVGLGAFATKLSPNLAVSAELVRPDGTVVWKQTRMIVSDGKGTIVVGVKGANIGRGHAHLHEEYVRDPQLLRAAYQAVAEAAAQQLVADLRTQA